MLSRRQWYFVLTGVATLDTDLPSLYLMFLTKVSSLDLQDVFFSAMGFHTVLFLMKELTETIAGPLHLLRIYFRVPTYQESLRLVHYLTHTLYNKEEAGAGRIQRWGHDLAIKRFALSRG